MLQNSFYGDRIKNAQYNRTFLILLYNYLFEDALSLCTSMLTRINLNESTVFLWLALLGNVLTEKTTDRPERSVYTYIKQYRNISRSEKGGVPAYTLQLRTLFLSHTLFTII